MPWPHIRATALALKHHLSVCIILYIRQQLVRVQWLIFESCRSDSWTLLEPFWACLWPQGLTPSAHLKFHFSLPDGNHMPILSKFNCFSFQSLLCSCNAWRNRSSPNNLIPPPIFHLQWTQKKNIRFLQDHPLKPSRMWRISQCSLQKKSPPPRGPPQSTFAETSNSLFSSFSNLTVQCLQNNQLAPLQLRGRNWFPITFSFLLSSCTLFWLDGSYARGCPGKSNWELSGFGFWIDCRCRRGFAAKIQRKLLWYSFRFFGNLKAAVISYWKNLCSV